MLRSLFTLLAMLIAIPQVRARQTDLELPSERIAAGDVQSVERELRDAIARGETISNALWKIERHARSLFQSFDLATASAWVDLLERITVRDWPDQLVALYAAIDRAEIQLRLGWPDLADAGRKNIQQIVARFPAEHSIRGYAVAASGLFELDLALASEAFERVLSIADELVPSLAPHVLPLYSNEIDSRVALARYGIARKDRATIDLAVKALEGQVRTDTLDAQTRARHALAIADLEMRRSDASAAMRALEEVSRLLDQIGANAAADLLAMLAALRVRIALDFDLGTENSERDEAELAAILRKIFREADARTGAVLAFADAGGPQGFLHYGALQDALGEWIRIAARNRSNEAAFDCVLEAQAAGWLSHSERVTLADIRSEVLTGADHALIVMVPGSYRVLAFTITHEAIVLHEMPSTIDLKPRRDDLDRFMATPLDDEQLAKYFAVAAQTADAYLPRGVRNEIADCTRWSISAMGALASLPFEALVVDGEPIGLSRDVDRLPALPLAVRVGRRARVIDRTGPRAADVLRVVAPAYSAEQRARFPELVSLEFARDSITAIESLYPKTAVVTHFGKAACFPGLLDPTPAVVEFYAHAVLLADSTRPMALALEPSAAYQSGFIDAEAFEKWLTPRVAILAVCSSAQGPYRAGNEGSMSLVGSLLDVGVESVIAAARRIEARATLSLVEHLHRALALGHSPAAALRIARNRLVQERGACHPSEFAHLVAIGNGQRPVFVVGDVDVSVEGDSGRVSRTWRWLASVGAIVGLLWIISRLRRRLRIAHEE